MATQAMTMASFESTIDNNDVVMIDFWAEWCGPCRAFAPIFEEASEKHPDIVFAKVDTETERELAAAFGIRSIPTLAIFREGVPLLRQAGLLPPAALEELIQKVQELDMDEVRAELAARKAEQDAG